MIKEKMILHKDKFEITGKQLDYLITICMLIGGLAMMLIIRGFV